MRTCALGLLVVLVLAVLAGCGTQQLRRASLATKSTGNAMVLTGLRPGEAAPQDAINRLLNHHCGRVLSMGARAYCMTDRREAAEAERALP